MSGRTIGVFSLAPQCANPHFRSPWFSSGHLECYILFALTFARLYLLPCGYGEQTCKKKEKKKKNEEEPNLSQLNVKSQHGELEQIPGQSTKQVNWSWKNISACDPSAGGAQRTEASSSNGCVFMYSFYLSAYTVLPACLLFSSAELLMVEIRLMIKIII